MRISTVPTPPAAGNLHRTRVRPRSDDLRPRTRRDPPAAARPTLDPFPGNTIPASRFDPVAVELLDRYPLPNLSGTANNYRRVAHEDQDQDQFDVRVDHRSRKTIVSSDASRTARDVERSRDSASRRERGDLRGRHRRHRDAVQSFVLSYIHLFQKASREPAPIRVHPPWRVAPGSSSAAPPPSARHPGDSDERSVRQRVAHVRGGRLPAARARPSTPTRTSRRT